MGVCARGRWGRLVCAASNGGGRRHKDERRSRKRENKAGGVEEGARYVKEMDVVRPQPVEETTERRTHRPLFSVTRSSHADIVRHVTVTRPPGGTLPVASHAQTPASQPGQRTECRPEQSRTRRPHGDARRPPPHRPPSPPPTPVGHDQPSPYEH